MRRKTFLRMALGLPLLAFGPLLPGDLGSRPGAAQGGGLLAPRTAPQGQWARVVSASPKWVVIENELGQQFPISMAQGNVGLFIMRWPTAPNLLTPRSIVEVTGIQAGSNQVQANHLDVFEPDAQSLLSGPLPAMTLIVGYNRVANPYGVDPNNAYNGYSMVYSLPGEHLIPNRLHVVAPVLNANPLQLAVGNNNAITVLPAGVGIYMTQVTAGSSSYVQPGDLVYYLATGATTKSLTLAQLVVYKTMPLNEFAAP